MKKHILLIISAVVMAVSQTRADYTIYPVPHSMTMDTGSCTLTETVNIRCDATIDAATLQRARGVLETAGLAVTNDDDEREGVTQLLLSTYASTGKVADAIASGFAPELTRMMKDEKYDRHVLMAGDKGIAIVGEHTNAVFFALASLEQMLEQRNVDGSLPAVTIYDYADQKNRGLVEGYYGYPYSVSVKKDLMRFMMRCKMNTYLYGAKSDPYHSQYWQQPYPTGITEEQEKNGWLSQEMVKDLAKTSAETKVNFIWAIHPGNNFLGSATVINDIMRKFTDMHRLGVRQFAVFVDDVGIPSSQADMALNATRITNLQKAIEEKWNAPSAEAADTVRPLHFVPQIYCSSFASSAEQRQNFMAALGKTPSYITIYTTGQGVWTVPNSGHMQNMHNELGRDMAWWWNYPCNDNADAQIYPMDMYSNFRDMPAVDGNATMPASLKNTVGLVANPMQQGEVAKTALFSVADYAWNNSAFNNQKSWEASFRHLIADSETREAYRFITRYLRWNEPSSVKTLIDSYKSSLNVRKPNGASLRSLMGDIVDKCTVVERLQTSSSESDRLLYADLRPWLLKLKKDCQTIMLLLDVAEEGDQPEKQWEDYLEALQGISDLAGSTDYTAYALEGMGNGISVSQRQALVSQLYIEPFLEYMKTNAMKGCFTNQTPATKATYITNQETLKPTVSSSDNVVTVSASQRLYARGQFAGIELPQATRLDSVFVGDTLFANHTLLYSSNGKEWKHLTSASEAPDVPVRYFVVANEKETPISFRLYKNEIKLFMPKPTTIADVTIPTDREVWQGHTKDLIVDGNYSTFCTLNRNQQAGDEYTLDLGRVQTIHDVRICMGTVNGDYMTEGRVKVSEDGNKWFALRAKGVTDHFRYTMDMPQNVKYSDEMTYCDFDGRKLQARYVSLSLRTPNTSKWLRLYEIEVNKRYYEKSMRQLCTDGDGINQTSAIDGNASTFVEPLAYAPLTYYLESIWHAESVTIYSNPATLGGSRIEVEAVSADGTVTGLGTLGQGIQTFSLADIPDAVALHINFDGAAPAIHEIVPAFDENPYSVLTSISEVRTDAHPSSSLNPDIIYDMQGRRLSHKPSHGIYIRGNRKVLR